MSPVTVGFCGKKRSGKNYCANLLQRELETRGFHVEQRAFATRLKEYAQDVRHLSFRRMRRDMKWLQIPTHRRIAVYVGTMFLLLNPKAHTTDEYGKPRFLLQRLGTDVFRRFASSDYWVRLAISQPTRGEVDFILMTDVRFQEEGDICDLVVRVSGPMDSELSTDTHASEQTHTLRWDLVVDNHDLKVRPDISKVLTRLTGPNL